MEPGSCKGVRPATPRDEKADLHFDEEVLHIDDLVPDQALQARTLKSRIIRYVSDYCDYECSTLVKSVKSVTIAIILTAIAAMRL
jgi:predicted small integral membrane protein